MTVKTAVTLCIGAAVGFFFGMETDDRTKERVYMAIRKKIFRALTGEEMPDPPRKGHYYKYEYQYAPYGSRIKKTEKEKKDHD